MTRAWSLWMDESLIEKDASGNCKITVSFTAPEITQTRGYICVLYEEETPADRIPKLTLSEAGNQPEWVYGGSSPTIYGDVIDTNNYGVPITQGTVEFYHTYEEQGQEVTVSVGKVNYNVDARSYTVVMGAQEGGNFENVHKIGKNTITAVYTDPEGRKTCAGFLGSGYLHHGDKSGLAEGFQ